MRILILATIVITTVMFSSCEKTTGIFAPEFVCKIDGDKYKPRQAHYYQGNPLKSFLSDTLLTVFATLKDGNSIALRISDTTGIKATTYIVDDVAPPSHTNAVVGVVSTSNNESYITDSLHTGEIKIKYLSYEEKRISGYFNFKAKNPLNEETVEVTDGKFNIRF